MKRVIIADFGFDMLLFPSPGPECFFIGWLAFVRRTDGKILDYVALSRPSYESRLLRSNN